MQHDYMSLQLTATFRLQKAENTPHPEAVVDHLIQTLQKGEINGRARVIAATPENGDGTVSVAILTRQWYVLQLLIKQIQRSGLPLKYVGAGEGCREKDHSPARSLEPSLQSA